MQRRTVSPRKPPERGMDPPAFDPLILPKRKPKPQNTTKPSKIPNFLTEQVNTFMNARTGVQGCRLAGIIRVCYATLYLYSLFLMAIQAPTLFGPRKGLIPYSISGENVEENDYSIFEFFPQSSFVMYAMFMFGLCSGVLLLLGVYPRWGAAGAYFMLYNLRHHNNLIYDHEFHMNRTWAFFVALMPLDHITISDGFGGLIPYVRERLNLPPSTQLRRFFPPPRNLSTSWPMWPFRLWQVYTCMVYMGAALGKFNTFPWKNGTALAWIWYDEGMGRFYPNFLIDLLYNRPFPVKLQTYMSLMIEMLCFITIWPLKTRKITFAAIVMLHIGIELALVMHIFEYLSVLGWACFFVYPNDGKSHLESILEEKKYERTSRSALGAPANKRKKLIETAVVASLLYLLIYNTFPREPLEEAFPLGYLMTVLVAPPSFMQNTLDTLLSLTGLQSGPYLLFDGLPPSTQARLSAVIRFNDGRDPILYREKDWADSNLFEREINYWYDTYQYYLLRDDLNEGDIPYYATFAVRLAEIFDAGNINREYNKIEISSDIAIESISIKVHKRQGSQSMIPPELGSFEPIPRSWHYESTCHFVFDLRRIDMNGEERIALDMHELWDFDEDSELSAKTGCSFYNKADDVFHRRVQYGEPSQDDVEEENDEDEEEEEEEMVQPMLRTGNDDGDDEEPIYQEGRGGAPEKHWIGAAGHDDETEGEEEQVEEEVVEMPQMLRSSNENGDDEYNEGGDGNLEGHWNGAVDNDGENDGDGEQEEELEVPHILRASNEDGDDEESDNQEEGYGAPQEPWNGESDGDGEQEEEVEVPHMLRASNEDGDDEESDNQEEGYGAPQEPWNGESDGDGEQEEEVEVPHMLRASNEDGDDEESDNQEEGYGAPQEPWNGPVGTYEEEAIVSPNLRMMNENEYGEQTSGDDDDSQSGDDSQGRRILRARRA